MGSQKTTLKELFAGVTKPAGERHTFVIDRHKVETVEVDDLAFHKDSAVMLPAPNGPAKGEQGRVSGLRAVAAALQYAADNAGRKLVVAGHTEAVGHEGMEVRLSERRALNVYQYLKGERENWAHACAKHVVADYQLILAWIGRVHGYGCNPGAVDNLNGPKTRAGVYRFRVRYNDAHQKQLKLSGPLVAEDWMAFFDMYDQALAALLEVEVGELSAARGKLVFVDAPDPPVLGCGAAYASAGQDKLHYRSSANRRVELAFIEQQGEMPDLSEGWPAGYYLYANDWRFKRQYGYIEPDPEVECVRLFGAFFDTDKCFLLPSAMAGIRKVREVYEKHPNAELLIVGHTDTSGEPEYNDPLSLERAESMKAFLTDDVDAWLEHYDKSMPKRKRWGELEDLMMIEAMPDAASRPADEDPVRWYQRTRGLKVDGIAGPNTRSKLIAEYMATDGTTLPPGITPTVHGCGENFPEVPTGDDQEEARNRRAECFFFDEGIDPPPPGDNSGPNSTQYPAWRQKVTEEHDLTLEELPTAIEMRLHDGDLALMPETFYRALLGQRVLQAGRADADAFITVPLPAVCPESIGLQWGAESADGPFEFATELTVLCNSENADDRVRVRLQNLGYDVEYDFEHAVSLFQLDHQVDHEPEPLGLPNGTVPEATVAKVDEIYETLDLKATPA